MELLRPGIPPRTVHYLVTAGVQNEKQLWKRDGQFM